LFHLQKQCRLRVCREDKQVYDTTIGKNSEI
jgi:hypothetical protein